MFLWDLLFPRRCLGCGSLGSYLCARCVGGLKEVRVQKCLYCGRAGMWGLTHPACRKRNGIDGTISLYYYNNTLKKIIAGIKYRLVAEAFSDLFFVVGRRSAFLTETWQDQEKPTLNPIPQSPLRTNQRGFNQAKAIVRMFSYLLSIPTADLLVKRRETISQASLPDRSLRKGNQKGVFQVKKGVKIPDAVILVDDVITTGETVKEAAKTLKKQGVRKVYALSVAKG